MTEPLAAVETELNEATERARRLVDSTPGRMFTVRPTLTQWSAAECLAHLSVSSELFLPVLRRSIDDAHKRRMKATRPPRMDLLGRILRWFLEPPVRSRVKTTAAFVPKAIRAKSEALAEFSLLQSQLIDVLHSAADVPMAKLKIVSPFDSRVRYNVFSAFRIMAAHQRRHLWQAEQAVEALKKAQTIE
ncbi:MAG TPA: DinB family protein [Thermoanaerobaculia bacterium]|nr:DinB family protein [Thermoanaerobaculia bacterium]